MVRLVLAGEMPLLLPDDRLSARVFHPEAKSADLSRTWPDVARTVELHRAQPERVGARCCLRYMPLLERVQWLSPPPVDRRVAQVRRRPARTPAGAHPPEDPDPGQAIALSLKLSVITPSLNQGAFIERTIRSVLDQGYENLEYLVVDGGSTDETVEVIERYDDRIDWWVSEADAGQTDAIDKGLERATGDVIAYINSDDYYLPGAFATALGALERSGASWVAGAAINVDPEGRRGAWDTGDEWRPEPPQALERTPRGRHWWIVRNWSVPQPAAFWRRELFDRHGEFRRDLHFALDVEFMERLALAGEMPLLLPDDFLAARVLHPAAKSSDHTRWHCEYKLLRANP